jgi:Trk-type K+ transport system membrane component
MTLLLTALALGLAGLDPAGALVVAGALAAGAREGHVVLFGLVVLVGTVVLGTTLNDVGPGLGQVGATESFEIVNPFGRVVLTVCMLLGRLEIFTVLALLSPAFWKR